MALLAIAALLLASTHAGVRVLLPSDPSALASEKAFASLVDEYNRSHTQNPVEIIRKGSGFSSLKDLIALKYAGALPDLVAIEYTESPALEGTEIGKKIPSKIRSHLAAKESSIPWLRIAPILVIDEEMLFRIHADTKKPPTDWKGVVELCKSLAQNFKASPERSEDQFALAIPLQGPRGLWIFEAIAARPLWSRKAGGIKANRDLIPDVQSILELLDQPRITQGDHSWEHSIQDFLDRKASLLVASTDALPRISAQARFRWMAVPLPKLRGGISDLAGGADLVVVRDAPEIYEFIDFLFSPITAARWLTSGGFLPFRSAWSTSKAWRTATERMPEYAKIARMSKAATSRTTDRELIRIRLAWARALQQLFGARDTRSDPETTFNLLDKELNTLSNE